MLPTVRTCGEPTKQGARVVPDRLTKSNNPWAAVSSLPFHSFRFTRSVPLPAHGPHGAHAWRAYETGREQGARVVPARLTKSREKHPPETYYETAPLACPLNEIKENAHPKHITRPFPLLILLT